MIDETTKKYVFMVLIVFCVFFYFTLGDHDN